MSATSLDFAARAIRRMRGPAEMGIICVDITNKCDLKCSNCTRLLANQDKFWEMSLDNLRLALRSLRDFPGTIAIIGGNPCMHRDFEGVCRVLVEETPNKNQRGLWTNNVFGFAELAIETFGVFNLNPHGDARGEKSLEPLKHLGWYYKGNSEHSSLLAAVRDFYGPEEMWSRIADCDINKNWSAAIVENKGELRAYFCEVAASFDLARGEDHGFPLTDGWWRRSIDSFADQIRHFCPGCGVPARMKGQLDKDETDAYSATNADLALKSQQRKKRKVIEMKREQAPPQANRPVTTYSTNLVSTRRVAVITPYYKESIEVLRQCHESVLAQNVDGHVRHIFVADGHARAEIDGWGVDHIALPRAHGDNGDTPRAIGAILAESEGYDFISFLDADNWFLENHLNSLLQTHAETGAAICTSFRMVHTPDGALICRVDANGQLLVVNEYAEAELRYFDTSCMLLHRSAFSLNRIWGRIPREISPICDRIFFAATRYERIPFVSTKNRTVAFRSTYPDHYLPEFGIAPPEGGAQKAQLVEKAFTWLMTKEGVESSLSLLGFWPMQFLNQARSGT